MDNSNRMFSVCRAVWLPYTDRTNGDRPAYDRDERFILIEIDGPLEYKAAIRAGKRILRDADAPSGAVLILYNNRTGTVTPVHREGSEPLQLDSWNRWKYITSRRMGKDGIATAYPLPSYLNNRLW